MNHHAGRESCPIHNQDAHAREREREKQNKRNRGPAVRFGADRFANWYIRTPTDGRLVCLCLFIHTFRILFAVHSRVLRGRRCLLHTGTHTHTHGGIWKLLSEDLGIQPTEKETPDRVCVSLVHK